MKTLKKTPEPYGSGVFSCLAVLDPWETDGNPYNFNKDSSHLLLLEFFRRGHSVFYADPSGLRVQKGKVMVHARPVQPVLEPPYFHFDVETTQPLKSFDCVLMRKDPPVDAAYLQTTQVLSREANHTLILNNPQALRDWNEKLIILQFPRWIPPTLVSGRAEEINTFVRSVGGVAIAKPLDGFGGKGVQKLDRKTAWRGSSPCMIQKFLPAVSQGEKRIFMIDGTPLGALLKIPPQGGFLTNPDKGASIRLTTLTTREKNLCRALGPFLRRHGIFWAGIDTIDGWLTEINITSPGLLWEWNEVDGKHHEKEIVDLLERRLSKC